MSNGTKWYTLNLTGEPVAPVTRYNVTATAAPVQGGTVKLSGPFVNSKVKPEETVTATIKSNVGWRCNSISATDAEGNLVDVTVGENGTYTFVMPEADVTLEAAFVRSTGNVFELVTTRDSIVEGGIYVIATKYYDKAMKFHAQGESTFGSTDIVEWLDEDKTRLRVNDETCFIQMTAVNPDTIRHGATSGARTNAFLSYGNGYLTTSDGNLIVSAACTDLCRAGMFVSTNESNFPGDDRAPAVLGYSDKGTFDKENVPEAMQWLLDSYATQIEELNKGAKAAPVTRSGDAIRPLVTAMWSQNSPYNSMLPMLNNGKQAVSGCVATALAQVLYYWKQPARPTQTIPAYTSRSFGIYMPALEPADIIWDAMQDTYLSNDTESEGAQAAALLTLYCAQLVNMDFQYGASAANGRAIPAAISTYMGYKASAHCENRENFSTQAWADYIYNELAEGRPVIYSGSKRTGGHSFVCDGYDGEGMFHMNWGWDGMSNGYYLLNVVNPDAQGTGSSAGNYGYILEQYIVAGMHHGAPHRHQHRGRGEHFKQGILP